jgi:hypothetical protein
MDSVVGQSFKNELPTIITKTLVSTTIKAGIAYGINKAVSDQNAIAGIFAKVITGLGQALMQALGGLLVCFAKKQKPPRSPGAAFIADELRRFEADVSEIWHARNRPSEYFRVRTALMELARRLDRAALGLPPLRRPVSP